MAEPTATLDNLEQQETLKEDEDEGGEEKKRKYGAFSYLFCAQCCLLLTLFAAIPAIIIVASSGGTNVATTPTTSAPSGSPTAAPVPTKLPTSAPTNSPVPTKLPTVSPTKAPVPTKLPTVSPTKAPVPTKLPTTSPTKAPVPTPQPTTSPTKSPTTPKPTFSPTPAPTRVVECAVTVIDTTEDAGRVQDPGDESIIVPGSGQPGVTFTVTVNVATASAFQNLSGFTVTSSPLGDVYDASGSIVTSVPSASFVEGPTDFFTLSGLTFLPRADLGEASSKISHAVTFARKDGGFDLDEPCVSEIRSCAKADIPSLLTVSQCLNATEGSDVTVEIFSTLNDIDGSEVIEYQLDMSAPDVLRIESVNSVEILSSSTGVPARNCESFCQAGEIVVSPSDEGAIAGFFSFSIYAKSKEKRNPCTPAEETQLSPTFATLTFNVLPVATEIGMVVIDAQGVEDEPLALLDFINFQGSTDDGEVVSLILLESSVPAGSVLTFNGLAASPTGGEFEVELDLLSLPSLQLTPPEDSNEDFTLEFRVKVVDSVTGAPSCSVGLMTDTYLGPIQTMEVELQGKADAIVISGDSTTIPRLGEWTRNPVVGVTEILAHEGTAQALNVPISQGEVPGDTSESIFVVIAIPSEIVVYNSSLLSLIGADLSGVPLYDVSLEDLSEVFVARENIHSTVDMDITLSFIVSENDGDFLESTENLRINFEPVIDTTDYFVVITNPGCTEAQVAVEDELISLPLVPPSNDRSEQIAAFQIAGLAAGNSLISSGATLVPFPVPGSYELSSTHLSNGVSLQLVPDSNEDVSFGTAVVMEQTDPDGELTATKTVLGSISIQVRAKVESSGVLALRSPLGAVLTSVASGSDGVLDFSTGSSLGELGFQETDGTSVESIQEMVIEFPAANTEGFLVDGGIYDGEGSWTVPKANLGSVQIRAVGGFSGSLSIIVHAIIVDEGDPSTSISCEEQFNTTILLDFSANTFVCASPLTKAATITTADNQQMTGAEDSTISFSSVTTTVATAGDQPDDKMSIVFEAAGLSGASTTGTEKDFVNNRFVQHVSVPNSGNVDFSSVGLKLPGHVAGDFTITAKFANLDMVCGDVELLTRTFVVRSTPVVDATGVKMILVGSGGLDSDDQPVGLSGGVEAFRAGRAMEDGIIQLTPELKTVDTQTLSSQGVETASSLTLTALGGAGSFLDNTTGAMSTSIVGDGESTFFFVPTADLSGDVSIQVASTIEDRATYTFTSPSVATSSATFTETFTLSIEPVCDPISFGGTSAVVTQEGSGVSVGGSLSIMLGDSDSSEVVTSVFIDDLPKLFRAAPARNLGASGWKHNPTSGTDLSGLSIIPPSTFSGSVNLTLRVLAVEDLAEEGEFCSTSLPFTLVVEPVPEPPIVTDLITSYVGTEGDSFPIRFAAKSRAIVDFATANPGVTQNPKETLLVQLTNVPDGFSILSSSPPGATITQTNTTSWTVSGISELDSVSVNSNDLNGLLAFDVEILTDDQGVILPSGQAVTATVDLDISPVNDAPFLIGDLSASLDGSSSVLLSFVLFDNDAGSGDLGVAFLATDGFAQMTFTQPSGNTATLLGNAGHSVLVEGTLVELNEVFAGGLNYTGAVGSITATITDNGNTGGPPQNTVEFFLINP